MAQGLNRYKEKIWVITDTANGTNRWYAKECPLEYLNDYLIYIIEDARQYGSKRSVKEAEERHKEVFEWMKKQDLDGMHVGQGYFCEGVSVECVELLGGRYEHAP